MKMIHNIFNLRFLFALVFTLGYLHNYAQTCTSTGDGDWDDSGTWSCSSAANYPDDSQNGGTWNGTSIIINDGDVVNIPNNTDIDLDNAAPITITIKNGATLYFNSNPELLLPVGSTITIESGGTLDAKSSSSGTLIQIGGTGIWGRGAPASCPSNETITVAGSITESSTCPTNAILPVNFLNFTASEQENLVELNWSTTEEINNSHFVVQESFDEINFIDQGTIEGEGNSNTIQHYSFSLPTNDENTYYRIKQVDFNGDFDYSKIITHINNTDDFYIYPNPSKNKQVNINLSNYQSPTTLQVTNEIGQVVYEIELLNNIHSFNVNLPGIYFVKVIHKGNVTIKKLVVN